MHPKRRHRWWTMIGRLSLMPPLHSASMIIGHMAFLVRYRWIINLQHHILISFAILKYCIHQYIRSKELSKSQKEAIQSSKRISNPGCYPTGFIALIRPLVTAGIIPPDAPLTVNAISGYSGGGKGLIEIYESDDHEPWGAYGYSMVRCR